MPLETKLLIASIVVIAAGFVLAVTRVLGAWIENNTVRHDLIANSKRKRLEYMRSVAEREHAISGVAGNDSIIIEDDDEPADYAQAA